MRIMNSLLAATAGILLLASCDPSGSENYYVNNDSDDEIVVYMKNGIAVTIVQHTENNVAFKNGLGYGDTKAGTDYVPTDIDRIVRVKDSAVSNKDFSTYANWKATKKGKHDQLYYLFIQSSDFSK